MRRAAGALAALVAAGCAGPRATGSGFAFPDAFEANQLVTVRTGDETRELLASLRRAGEDHEVTLFDPVFAVPLLSASTRGGSFTVHGPRGPGADDVARLLALLGDLYDRSYRPAGADRFEAKSGMFTFRLFGVSSRGSCSFPDRIEVEPRVGSAVHLDVVTIDVSCGARTP